MEIDLIKISKLNLNINEYLTLIKLDKSNKGINFPFTSTTDHLRSLAEKRFITVINDFVTLTEAGKNVVFPKVDINFNDIFEIYPHSTPNGRKLRAKTKTIGGRLTKDYVFLKEKYLSRVKSTDMHTKIIEATKEMLNDRKRQNTLEYLRQFQYYITSQGWEQYMNEDGEVDHKPINLENLEKL